MQKSLVLASLLLLSSATVFAQDLSDITLGTRHRIFSDTLDEEREYWISLPAGTEYGSYPLLWTIHHDRYARKNSFNPR